MERFSEVVSKMWVLVILLVLFISLLSGCDRAGERLESQEVKLKDGRTVQCVREIGVNTKMTCDWDNAK